MKFGVGNELSENCFESPVTRVQFYGLKAQATQVISQLVFLPLRELPIPPDIRYFTLF